MVNQKLETNANTCRVAQPKLPQTQKQAQEQAQDPSHRRKAQDTRHKTQNDTDTGHKITQTQGLRHKMTQTQKTNNAHFPILTR